MARNLAVLVVDDEIQIQRLLKLGLGADGFTVISARTAAEVLHRLADEDVDLVILDIGLPDRSGLEVLEEIRKTSMVPVVVLSVRNSERDKVRAFELGANDYVTKPFGMAELAARLRTALKHRYQSEGILPKLRWGDLQIDLVNRRVTRDDKEISLTKTEYEILALLAKHAGRVVTHEFILRNICGAGSDGDAQYLRVYVSSLRSKLGARVGSNQIIRTEVGVGYRLMAPSAEAVNADVS